MLQPLRIPLPRGNYPLGPSSGGSVVRPLLVEEAGALDIIRYLCASRGIHPFEPFVVDVQVIAPVSGEVYADARARDPEVIGEEADQTGRVVLRGA